ncbi:putative lipoprotein [Haemophilus pittmaniae HK 85]|uniref:Putative lipoprotein n=1 Tax=Haemophilus pittmaniae HK 85 TaxID=1035188 RepID=F9QBQ9_9PAST|nr:hypothetical protein [Haemophilus pittmaniae]EGV04977.1 putative lipoprotein [Haemophilus pittmaniae HK 85]SNV64382.1 Uncharacterised protein [Haemophilus pittmaniae]
MKLFRMIPCALAILAASACAPVDSTHHFSIDEALKSPEAASVLNPGVKLYFGRPAPGRVIVADAVTNKKTNASNKTPQEACRWAFLSAVKQLQEKAQSKGATKVGNIVSYYKKKAYSSPSQYECHTGNIIGGVALKGDIVK